MVENRISPCINADRKQYPQYANPHTTAFEKTGKMKANMNLLCIKMTKKKEQIL